MALFSGQNEKDAGQPTGIAKSLALLGAAGTALSLGLVLHALVAPLGDRASLVIAAYPALLAPVMLAGFKWVPLAARLVIPLPAIVLLYFGLIAAGF